MIKNIKITNQKMKPSDEIIEDDIEEDILQASGNNRTEENNYVPKNSIHEYQRKTPKDKAGFSMNFPKPFSPQKEATLKTAGMEIMR